MAIKSANNEIDKELEISIDLENFEYSGSKDDRNQKGNLSKFFGRVKEKKHLLDRLIQGKGQGGSFLVAGYRGAGKTRFVSEVLRNYKASGKKFIEVRVNLGNDSDLSSKSVLFNMVYLLNSKLREIWNIRLCRALFENILHTLAYTIFSLFIVSIFLGIISLDPNQEINTLLTNHPGGTTLFLFSCIAIWILMHNGKFWFFSTWKAFIKLQSLQQEIYSSIDNHIQIKSNFFDFKKKTTVNNPLTTNQIEARLKDILDLLKNKDIIFIFDELDKLSGRTTNEHDANLDLVKEAKLRKRQIDSILGDLKNLITSSRARFIFIAGRDMYDAYLSERGSSNSLYESLFHDHIYIPSLLTDRSDGEIYLLDGMIEAFVVSNLIPENSIENILKKKMEKAKELWPEFTRDFSNLKLADYVDFKKNEIEKQYQSLNRTKLCKEMIIRFKTEKLIKEKLLKEIYILKTLIHFLTLHSWGNCKRLLTLFESFVRKEKNKYQLYFSTRHIQRLILSSQLYILFHHNLSRMLMNADDKLVVSSFSIFHYILKYHGIGFSREHILRMYETINIHSSPELTRIVDVIIHNVLLNHVRSIRSSLYQYRFTFLYEKEIHFITTINDGESAAFNFSLNAMDAVKQHYKTLIMESKQTHEDDKYGHDSLASIHVIVGNFHLWEQSYDEASIHYGIALDILKKNKEIPNDPDKTGLDLQMVKIFLKLGAVNEKVGNYTAAATAYLDAERLANGCQKLLIEETWNTFRINRNTINWNSNLNDSKWAVLKQPRWARLFLNLKRGAIDYKEAKAGSLLIDTDPPQMQKYKQAVFLFFMERFNDARHVFIETAYQGNDPRSGDHESIYFLQGSSYLKAGFSLFLEWSDELHKKLKPGDSLGEIKEIEEITPLLEIFNSSIQNAFKGMEKDFSPRTEIDSLLSDLNPDKIEVASEGIIEKIILLLNLSALFFQKGKLNYYAAMSYLCMVMIWQAFLELIPWKKNEENNDKFWEQIPKLNITNDQKGQNKWVFKAQETAFEHFGFNTGEAYHHFMRSVLERNLEVDKIEPEFYFGKNSQRERILENGDLLYQHFSLFGQVVAASVYWEEMSINFMKNQASKNNDLILLKDNEHQLIPYGIRYYSLMLWLKGRKYLGDLLNSNGLSEKHFDVIAINAIVNLFRSSQYVIKTHGETSHMILPPLFMIYYNMWEVLFHLVQQESKNQSFQQAVYVIRLRLVGYLNKENIKDVSSRVLDLESVYGMARNQFKISEKMGDLSSNDRISVLKNKYYLDDDYEDNMFILDWSYCRFFAPGAMIHRKIMEYRMYSLEKEFTDTKVAPYSN